MSWDVWIYLSLSRVFSLYFSVCEHSLVWGLCVQPHTHGNHEVISHSLIRVMKSRLWQISNAVVKPYNNMLSTHPLCEHTVIEFQPTLVPYLCIHFTLLSYAPAIATEKAYREKMYVAERSTQQVRGQVDSSQGMIAKSNESLQRSGSDCGLLAVCGCRSARFAESSLDAVFHQISGWRNLQQQGLEHPGA